MLTWGAAIFFFTYYAIAGLGINLGYHRLLSHRSFRASRWLEYALVTLGLPAGTPVQWAGNHRFHHAHTDTPVDPHSPLYRGFLYAHTGWYLQTSSALLCVLYALAGPVRMLIDAWMRSRTNQEHNALAKDVAADPYYRWLSRKPSYALMMLVHFAVPASLAWHWWRVAGLAWFWLTVTVLYNLGDAIDSVSHILGDKLPGQADESRNSWLMGLLVLGEGWHANHHQFPRSARHGLFPGQFDWTWQVIRVLRLLGLATDIYLPSEREILNRPKA